MSASRDRPLLPGQILPTVPTDGAGVTVLKRPVGIASFVDTIARDESIHYAIVRRHDEWKCTHDQAFVVDGSTRETRAVLCIQTDMSHGEVAVAALALQDAPDVTGGAVVTEVMLREDEEFRFVAVVERALRMDLG